MRRGERQTHLSLLAHLGGHGGVEVATRATQRERACSDGRASERDLAMSKLCTLSNPSRSRKPKPKTVTEPAKCRFRFRLSTI